ncbi:hypothetical protein cym2001_59400 [Pseudomonas sp. CYM-20-01]|nr:hypothetical protein cym2001_59400 [Pseudomonas sp. CYM-20-01]
MHKIAKMTGANAADTPELLAGTTFPDAQAQQADALLKGGTAKFLKEKGKVEMVLPDYLALVTDKFISPRTDPCGSGLAPTFFDLSRSRNRGYRAFSKIFELR